MSVSANAVGLFYAPNSMFPSIGDFRLLRRTRTDMFFQLKSKLENLIVITIQSHGIGSSEHPGVSFNHEPLHPSRPQIFSLQYV